MQAFTLHAVWTPLSEHLAGEQPHVGLVQAPHTLTTEPINVASVSIVTSSTSS